MNFLITGGAGFIGSNVASRLLKDGHGVVLLDNLSRPNVFRNVMWSVTSGRGVKFLQYNVRNYNRVKQAIFDHKIDFIFHFAAQVGVQASIKSPRDDFEDNALGTFNVLEAARNAYKRPHVVFASTNKVYGDFKTDTPVSEKQPLSFCTPYGCSKGASEQYVLDYCRIYGLPTTVLRMSCIYGNRQFGTEEQGWLAHFTFSKERNEPVTVYGDGSQVRDVLYIDDYVELCMAIVGNQEKAIGQVFNVGGGDKNKISVLGAVEKIGNEYTLSGWRKSDQRYYVSDISKVKNVLGWEPKIGVEEGLERLGLWVKSQS